MGTSRLGNLLVEEGLLSEIDRRTIRNAAGHDGAAFARGLLALGLLDETDLAAFLADRTHHKIAPKDIRSEMDDSGLSVLDGPLLERLEILPLKVTGDVLTVAMADPLDSETIKQVEFFSGYRVRPVIATFSQIRDGLEKMLPKYTPRQTSFEVFLENHATAAFRHLKNTSPELDDPLEGRDPKMSHSGQNAGDEHGMTGQDDTTSDSRFDSSEDGDATDLDLAGGDGIMDDVLSDDLDSGLEDDLDGSLEASEDISLDDTLDESLSDTLDETLDGDLDSSLNESLDDEELTSDISDSVDAFAAASGEALEEITDSVASVELSGDDLLGDDLGGDLSIGADDSEDETLDGGFDAAATETESLEGLLDDLVAPQDESTSSGDLADTLSDLEPTEGVSDELGFDASDLNPSETKGGVVTDPDDLGDLSDLRDLGDLGDGSDDLTEAAAGDLSPSSGATSGLTADANLEMSSADPLDALENAPADNDIANAASCLNRGLVSVSMAPGRSDAAHKAAKYFIESGVLRGMVSVIKGGTSTWSAVWSEKLPKGDLPVATAIQIKAVSGQLLARLKVDEWTPLVDTLRSPDIESAFKGWTQKNSSLQAFKSSGAAQGETLVIVSAWPISMSNEPGILGAAAELVRSIGVKKN